MTYNHQNVGYISLLNNTNGLTYSQPNWAWYKMDAATASSITDFVNTVKVNGDVVRIWDYSNNGRHLYSRGEVDATAETAPRWKANYKNGLSVVGTASNGYDGLKATASINLSTVPEMTIVILGGTYAVDLFTNKVVRAVSNFVSGNIQLNTYNKQGSFTTHSQAYGFTAKGENIFAGTSSTLINAQNYRYAGLTPFFNGSSTASGNATASYITSVGPAQMEIMIWDRILSNNEILDVENYLKQKWNISY